MKRVIIDYHNLTPEMFRTLKDMYPDGYDDEDMVVFKNAKNETIKALEFTQGDTDYLVKISKKLSVHLDNLEIDEVDEVDLPDDPIIDDII